MNMVFHAVNHQRRAFPLFENARLVREQSIPMFLWN
jgi:hypothetical protein